MRGILPLAIAVLTFGIGIAGDAAFGQNTEPADGIFSSAATSLSTLYTTKQPTVVVPSPDGQSRVVARRNEKTLTLELEGWIGSAKLEIADGPNAEILWSPDSKAFFFTENSGGLASRYLLTVMGRPNGELVVRRLSDLVAREFGHPVRCFEPEPPNVAGVSWIGSSQELLVIAEIPPRSNCDSMGTFTAYAVDPWRMKILKRYKQPEAKALFRATMGPRASNANDECVTAPKSCYIPQLHPEMR